MCALCTDTLLVCNHLAIRCGHCKKLAPEYTKAASTLANDRILLAKVDATDDANSALKDKFGIRSFPTLKIFVGGEFTEDYDGGRTEDDIVKVMRAVDGRDPSPRRAPAPRRERAAPAPRERREPASQKDDQCVDNVDYTYKVRHNVLSVTWW